MFCDRDAPLTVVKGTYIKINRTSDHLMKRKWDSIGNMDEGGWWHCSQIYHDDNSGDVLCESMCDPHSPPPRRITETQMLRYLDEDWHAEMLRLQNLERKRDEELRQSKSLDEYFWSLLVRGFPMSPTS